MIKASHNSLFVASEIFTSQRPVYMVGDDGVVGHAWVCEGVKKESDHVYFVEFQIDNGYGNYVYHNYNFSSPANPWNPDFNLHFYMNWGWSGTDNGWYYDNNVNTSFHGSFHYHRENLYILK